MKQVKQYLGRRSVVFALIWAATYFAALLLLKYGAMPKPLSLAVALIPIVTFTIFIYNYIKGIAAMDEVRQRIHFEAAVIGFSLTLLLTMVLFLLSMCDITNFDWFGYPEMVVYCMLFYYIGFFISKKKYAA